MSSALSSAPVASSMGDAVKEKAKDTTVEVMPNDEGNSKEHDIASGSSTLDLAIRTAASSAPTPPKK
ncbi:hypothetical protein [Limnoglobus roseus]|uniref:hypothetical protein n=1 Tax=Limnoglobus roseus TaxID=2598579 RepID=UPI0011EB53F4|nr:hypothetical protein [Limnoglobus roseus]